MPHENEKLAKAAAELIQVVEGVKGSIEHGTWRDDAGRRLKDTPEWMRFYVASGEANQ